MGVIVVQGSAVSIFVVEEFVVVSFIKLRGITFWKKVSQYSPSQKY
jgi:hypothetical protein